MSFKSYKVEDGFVFCDHNGIWNYVSDDEIDAVISNFIEEFVEKMVKGIVSRETLPNCETSSEQEKYLRDEYC